MKVEVKETQSNEVDWGISYDNEDRTRVTLDELERILMPKIKKAELLERIEKLEEYVKELIDNPKVTVVHPPTWANDPGTVIGKGTIEIEEENPLEKITGVNESVEAIKNMLLRKGVLTEHDFMSYIIDKYDIKAPTISDCKPAEETAFEVGKVYKDDLAMFYCTRIEDGKPYGFGFGFDGGWCEDDDISFSGDFTEATPEEWFNRLEEEVNKKYKVGDKVKTLAISGDEILIDRIKPINFGINEFWTCCKDVNIRLMHNGKWAEIIEEPQYQAGTLGAFWDGEWDDAVCKRIAYLGTLEGKTKCDQFILKEANMCYLNFKPLKFDSEKRSLRCKTDKNKGGGNVIKDGKWAEIIEEPQYQIGTIGIFWDGDFDEKMSRGNVIFGELDHITENGHFRPKGKSWSWDNFKPIKID